MFVLEWDKGIPKQALVFRYLHSFSTKTMLITSSGVKVYTAGGTTFTPMMPSISVLSGS